MNSMVVQGTDKVGLAAYKTLFAHSSEGVLFGTQDGEITAANPAACAMLELTVEEICTIGCDLLVDQEDPRWRIAVAERERTGSAVGVARLRRGDGRFMEVELTGLQFRDEGGAAQTCFILHDLTGRLAVERELEELSARLLHVSRGDELTGFQNRRGLIAAGTQLLQFADRQSAPVHALFVDVSNVQDLNEHLGHQAGDAALQAVARALSVTFRKNDVLARIGGTQFLVLTLQLDDADGAALTTRVREHLAATETRAFVGAPVEICCGWTTRAGGDDTSLEDLVARSDWAMLESREGRTAAFGPAAAPAPAARRTNRAAGGRELVGAGTGLALLKMDFCIPTSRFPYS
jgi:diguanylate cyclase (GGDEF)-like protein/PAS domain S-box-containing protein